MHFWAADTVALSWKQNIWDSCCIKSATEKLSAVVIPTGWKKVADTQAGQSKKKKKKALTKQNNIWYKNNLKSRDMAEFQLMLRLPSRPTGKCFAFFSVFTVLIALSSVLTFLHKLSCTWSVVMQKTHPFW